MSSGRNSSSSVSRSAGGRSSSPWPPGRRSARRRVCVLGRPRPRGLGRAADGDRRRPCSSTAAGVALAGLLLEAFFRSARLQSLQAFDAWAFWVPKAKAIFYFGGLDAQVFTTSAGPTYPPIVPILDAAAFHAMGGVDVVTFHLQFWFLVAGGVAAIAGCLHRHAPAWPLWPSLLLVLTVPRFGERLLTPAGGRARRPPLRGRCAPARALAARRPQLEARLRRRPVRGRDADEARGPALRRPRRSWPRSAATWPRRRRAWPAPRPRHGDRRRRRRSRGGSGTGRTTSPARRPRPSARRRRSTVPSTRCGSRSTCCSMPRLWSVVPFVAAARASSRDSSGAIGAWRRSSRRSACSSSRAAPGSRTRTRRCRSRRTRPLNPIVRYTGALVLLAAVSMPLLVGSAWQGGGGGASRESLDGAPARGRHRRRTAARVPRRGRGRRCPLPVYRRLRPQGSARARRTRSTSSSAGVTRRPRRSAYSSVSEASGMSTPE